MSVEENKAVVRRFLDEYNDRNMDIFDELVASDFIDHSHDQRGRESLKQLFTMAFEAFPDWHEAIEDIVAEGDKVWLRVHCTGTQTGDWNLFGAFLPATGKEVTLNMLFIWRVVDGRLAEGWELDDDRDFLRQLGVIEYTELGKPLESVFG